MDYPEKFLRGIPNNSFTEISINWNDDEGALDTIFNQKKKDKDEYQFKVGAAVLSKVELDRLCKKPQVKNGLCYERRKVEGNDYHGNILLKKDTSKPLRNLIASSLALCVEEVKPRE